MIKFVTAFQCLCLLVILIGNWENNDPVFLVLVNVGFIIISCSYMICEEIRDQGKRR